MEAVPSKAPPLSLAEKRLCEVAARLHRAGERTKAIGNDLFGELPEKDAAGQPEQPGGMIGRIATIEDELGRLEQALGRFG